jgi:pilus assembly protein CpaF
MKITFHTRDPMAFPYDIAVEIVRSMGGELEETARRVAGSFDYVFHFVQLKKKNQKRLRGIYELSLSPADQRIQMTEICAYVYGEDRWEWRYHIGGDKRAAGEEEDAAGFFRFEAGLRRLAAGGTAVGGTAAAGGAAAGEG